MGRVAGNNGGGVICIRNASLIVSDNTFSHNSAAGDAGVICVDESDIIIERTTFNNNTAGGNGGVLHTYFYPTRYRIIDSSFTNNQAGGDGGVMYVGRAGSHVTVSQSTFGFNDATNRGGVIAIIGSTLEMNRASVFENTAAIGEVVSTCNSNIEITNPELLVYQDPIYSFCYLYNNSNATQQTTSMTEITTNLLIMPSTTTQGEDLTTTTLPPTINDATSTEMITITTDSMAETTPEEGIATPEDVAMTTFTMTEDTGNTTTTSSQQGANTIAPAVEESITIAKTNDVMISSTIFHPIPKESTTISSNTDNTNDPTNREIKPDGSEYNLHTIIPGYRIAGKFRMVQIFVYFVWCLLCAKIKTTKI